jgi:hypothetical protein
MELNDKIFALHDEGLSPGKIAQKLKIKKAIVQDIIGGAANGGLGDTIEAFTEAAGIKHIVEKVADYVGADDCGCKARAEALNKAFPNRKMSKLLNSDYDTLREWFSVGRSSVSNEWQKKLLGVYNRVFNAKRQISSCSPCIAGMVRELKKVLDAAVNK